MLNFDTKGSLLCHLSIRLSITISFTDLLAGNSHVPSNTLDIISECPVIDYSQMIRDVPDFAVCHINEKCFRIECCVDVEYIRRTVSMYFEINFCDFAIYGGIEKMEFEHFILDYEWGKLCL